MTKQEFIIELTKKLSHNADEYYTNAIVDIIILAQQLDESAKPPVEQTHVSYGLVRELVQKHFRVKTLHEADEFDIVKKIAERNTLMSIKLYKEAAGIGLKDAKDDIDKVMFELFMKK